MRISSHVKRPTEAAALETLQAGLDAGVTLLDTAHAYGLDDGDLGHNERLIAQVRRPETTIVSKVGMRRPGGGWRVDGRRKTILAQAEACCEALGEPPDVLLLHAPDPRVSLATSARALRSVVDAGLARAVGASNVRFDQLALMREHVEISLVEVAVSPLVEEAVRGGVVEHCLQSGIRVLAHAPLGGPKRVGRLTRRAPLDRIAETHGVNPQTVALAWLGSLHPLMTPIAGVTRPETARLAAVAARLGLSPEENEQLDDAFPVGRLVRVPRAERAADPASTSRRVVVLMGVPAAGKSTRARDLVDRGFVRLNRDEAGGTLVKLARTLGDRLADGDERIVMDNTYPSRAQRNRVIETAWQHGVPVECIWLDTPLHEAHVNAVERMLERHGELLTPAQIKSATKKDPNIFPPTAQFRFQTLFESPSPQEGFVTVERVPFLREARATHDRAGLVIDASAWAAHRPTDGQMPVLVLAWKPGATAGELQQLRSAYPAEVSVGVCVHAAGPPICWCRKPLPGLVVDWMRRHRVDPGRSRYIGSSSADATLAERLGMSYVHGAP